MPFCHSVLLQAQFNFSPVQYTRQFNGSGLACTDCPALIVMPNASGMATLPAADSLGCIAVDSVFLTVLPLLKVYAPNVFRPDLSTDVPNSYFALFPSESVVEIRSLRIYDRWGGLQFERKNQVSDAADLRWDGRNARGKTADAGVFIWLAEILFTDGVVRVYTGDLLLLR